MTGGPGPDALKRLNALPAPAAVTGLLRVCGSAAWARRVAGARPFADREALLAAAEEAWDALDADDWREAFAAHPRIGETERSGGGEADRWSKEEQAGAAAARADVRAALADCQRTYEERFGHVFLIRAAGRTAGEMLAACRERLDNDPAAELGVAAEEERKIGRLRLDRILAEGEIP